MPQLNVELRGPAERTPVLLYLHGGPGNAFALLSFRSYVGPVLESRFLVCYLQQRGVMNSPAVPDSSQTVANHVADVQSVVAYLHNRFPGRKIYLLGQVASHDGLVEGQSGLRAVPRNELVYRMPVASLRFLRRQAVEDRRSRLVKIR